MKELFEIEEKYPDLRQYGNLFDKIKTPVCGHKSRECKIDGCNLYCKRQGE